MLAFVISLSQIVTGQKAGKDSGKLVTITGKVLTRDNDPVAGAILYVDNVMTNCTTKPNGSYKIKVSSSASRLEVRSEGFTTSDVEIGGKDKIDIILESDGNQTLNTGEKAYNQDVADSIKRSSRPKAKKMNTYSDIYQMIRGEVSGVIVTGRSIQIQQGHSFFGSSTPLFLVNGVKVMSIDNINPREVKSISVLKGSAASIYGNDGSNGVISITLKNGTEIEK